MHRSRAAAFVPFLLYAGIAGSRLPAQGAPAGFAEDWALAVDRAKVLDRLIPGTPDSYYYRCRYFQDTGAFDKVAPLLTAWIQRHGRTPRVIQIENRQALLTYDKDPQATLGFLQRRLGLRFDHERPMAAATRSLPSKLDAQAITPAAFTRRALKEHPGSVQGFRASAFRALLAGPVNDDLLLDLLERLWRPDVVNLPALVVRNLGHKRSGGFGSLRIHKSLLRGQLEECVRLRPTLLNEPAFVEIYLRRLRPDADVDWRYDSQARLAYLERLESFVQRLAPAHNSLKAHVLYHRLRYDLEVGRPDRARFLAYLRLPRTASYTNPTVRGRRRSSELVDATHNFPTGFARIGDDEPLVRAYLRHFFAREDSYEGYAEVVRSDYLRRLFAETKLLLGVGDMERWYSLLNDPAYYEVLKERVEVNFAATQRRFYRVGDPVAIDVDVKNVRKLLVKVFEISTFNYYRAMGHEVTASINLDGLVANHELAREYSENSLRLVRRHLELPELAKPGVYVVELIGNGISSRAVIRKGQLHYTERLGSAGHVFTVRDESGTPQIGASIWYGGKDYKADDGGAIVIPYSTKPGGRSMILRSGALSKLARFEHRAERYTLHAAFHVDRESLVGGSRARILVRPTLMVHGRQVALELLEKPVLSIRARDTHGIESTLDVRDFQLHPDRESVHEIRVPRDLASLTVALRGSVKVLSEDKTVSLASAARVFSVNGIDATPRTACPLLGRDPSGYWLDVRGKNGEPKAARAVRVTLHHRDYTDPFVVTLKTDERGRIELGALAGIVRVGASGFPDQVGSWRLQTAARTYPAALHGVVGETLRVAYNGREKTTTRAAVSLLEVRDRRFVRDAFEHVALVEGFLELRDLEPGDYSLWLKEAARTIAVRVTAGARKGAWAVGRDRLLGASGSRPLQITGVSVEAGSLRVRLANAGKDARVHILATRYLPPFDPFVDLRLPVGPTAGVRSLEHPESSYRSGREIGAEYRYILDRRFVKKYPGNMLRRPGLILNPWAVGDDASATETDSYNKVVGLGGGAGGAQRGVGRHGGSSSRRPDGQAPGTFPNLEFLPEPSVVLVNLRPDENGLVRVPIQKLGTGQLVQVVAVDARDTVYATLARPEVAFVPRSRTLARALDVERHYTEQRRIEFVPAGGSAVVQDAATARIETYDSLGDVYRLFATLSGNSDLQRFAFLLRWPELTAEQKRRAYEGHACHELHVFLHQKDPEFFEQVVRPYLANKASKTFVDDWLLDRDLRRYVEPWAFGRLNIVERILLAKRLQGESTSIQRHIRELFELQPRDSGRLARLFDSALAGGALQGKRERAKLPSKRRRETKRADGKKKAADEDAEEEVEETERSAADRPRPRRSGSRSPRIDLQRRKANRALFRAPDPTRPLAESNYWHRRDSASGANLVQVNAFWRDFALAPVGQPFVSPHVAEASGSFAEMMLALAFLDLPFVPAKNAAKTTAAQWTVRAESPLLLFCKELVPTAVATATASPILVSQNYYRLDEPYRYVGSQRLDAYVTGEFLMDVAYGCRVVVTNPSSAPRKLDLLLQIPQGAIPVQRGFVTSGKRVALAPYATASIDYAFYLPNPGDAPHYPVHVAEDGRLVAFAPSQSLRVVPEPTTVDTSSWQYVSQSGSQEAVLAYLRNANLQRVDLKKIAWRLRDRSVFLAIIGLLRERHVYSDLVWSYGIHHNEAPVVREYLFHRDAFLARCGLALVSPLVTLDPIVRHLYEHIEYEPLFNARAHRSGKRRKIANLHFRRQYRRFLRVLGERRQLSDADWMSATYYLLLQDRVGAALATFARVHADRLPMRIQYDYMRAYLDFFTEDTAAARQIALRYRDYPVRRWQELFREVGHQLGEAEGRVSARTDPKSRTQRQTALATQEPTLELDVAAKRVKLQYHNLASCEIRYYQMDVEFLFSTHPFVQQGSGSFAYIRPNFSETRALPAGKSKLSFDLPQQFQNSNVWIEVTGGGVTRRKAFYANSLAVQWVGSYGQLRVTDEQTGKPLRTVYIKVFARMRGGSVRFFKDGYTDLRGRFDYASLSADMAGRVERFAILVLSEKHGAVIHEVAPPAQ